MTFISRLILSLIYTSAILFGMPPLAQAEETPLIIHAVNYPPYEIEKPGSDGLRGFDVEVVIEAFKRVGLSAKVEFLPWNRVLSMAEKGTSVAALSCAKAEYRDSYLNYSDPISRSTSTYVASKAYKGDVPLTLADGKGHKVVVVGGYTNETDLADENIPYFPAQDDRAALNILLKRDFDFFYSTREFVQHVAVEMNIADQLQYFDVRGQLIFHLCFSRKWPNSQTLHDKFNIGLAEIRADGTYDAIHAKYQ